MKRIQTILLGLLLCLFGAGKGLYGQQWSITELTSETTFSNLGPTELTANSAVAIDSDSVLIAYGVANSGQFVVVNTSGETEAIPVTFHSSSLTGPAALMLDSDSVFISYRDDGDEKKGKYCVYNVLTGELEIPVTTFSDGRTGHIYFPTLADSSTVLIAYRDDGDGQKGKFLVVNPQTGKTKVEETSFSSGGINVCPVTALTPTSVLIVYNEAHPSKKANFLVVNPQTGAVVLPKTAFEDTRGIFSVTRLGDSRALVTYQRDESGKFTVLDTETGELSSVTTFIEPAPGRKSFSAVMLDADSVAFTGSGQFSI